MKSQAELIKGFVNGETDGQASNMYIDGDVLYSYGHHFPMLVRMVWGFMLNADKYSSTTSSHQSSCMKHATIQLPFSALRMAGIPYSELKLIVRREARYDWTGKYTYYGEGKAKLISKAEYEALSDEEKKKAYKKEERRPEAAVVQHGGCGKFYLSSMDGENYFLSELPEPASTIDDAFDMLMPTEVKGKKFLRQGEWFFVEIKELPLAMGGIPVDSIVAVADVRLIKRFYQSMVKKFTLPKKRPDSNSHVATRGCQILDKLYVSGQVRHVTRFGGRGDHRMLTLSHVDKPKVFLAYENRAVNSWSAGGRVD